MVSASTKAEELSLASADSGVRSLTDPQGAPRTFLVVGHGMVGQRMCQELRAQSALSDARIVVFGEEPTPAYDRVHLCRVIQGQPREALHLVSSDWYEKNAVELIANDPVVRIDRELRCVETQSGRIERYDHLILATGSTAVVGKIPGIDGPNVRVLRSVEDAEVIRDRALASAERGLPVVVVGGGLLGLELADELTRLGVTVEVLESADYPLSRQLERNAGTVLAEVIKTSEVKFTPGARVEKLDSEGDMTRVVLADGRSIECGLVVPAMGVRPRDQLARAAGIPCDLFGGIQVDDELRTADSHVSAVGECARHRGTAYGLVAPGYAMAEVVAKRLAGGKGTFSGVDIGTRLKVEGLELTVVGESAATGLGVKSCVYRDGTTFRRLAVRRGKVIGITAVGAWNDLARAQEAMARAEKLKPAQLERFERAEPMWKSSTLSLRAWPDDATVCTCMGVTCGTLKRAQRDGCDTVELLAERTGASTVCGTCRPLLATLTNPEAPEELDDSRWLLRASAVSALGAIAYVLIPAIPYADTVQIEGIDVLWRDETIKQITGFSLAGLFATSIVFSMRKRLSWLSFGDFESWRVAHALVGVLCLVGAFVHTGFRLGYQLDRALILVFLGSTLLGGVAGGWSLIASQLSPDRAQALRGWLVRSHIYLLWPLPVLLAFHVLKVYFF